MPLRQKTTILFTALLTVSLLANAVPAFALEGAETDYIIKYKESAAHLTEDDGVPFDVVSKAEALRLDRAGALEWYEPDGTATLMDSSFYESEQWNLDVIHAAGVFGREMLGQGVCVGVLDSGVNPHESFGERLLTGHNYIEDADESDTTDTLGHGTGVAGLIVGANERGFIGTAPGATLVPLKVTNGKEVSISAICRAIYGGIDDYGCNVLNLSLGVPEEYESLKDAVDYAAEKGVVIVAASGNDGTSTTYYPAGYDSVIGVGAVERDGTLYSRSSHNGSVCVTAPGVNVRSTGKNGGYKYTTGTSFAVAQVSGAAAVLLGIDPTLTPGQIMELLGKTATDRGVEGYDQYFGYGILNLTGCVEALTGEILTIAEQPSGQDPEPLPSTVPEPSDPEPSEPEPTDPESCEPEPANPGPSDPGPADPGPAVQPEIKTGYRDCPRDDSCVMSVYSDLDRALWYHDGVHFVLENGILNGVSDQTFAPNGSASRAMIVTMLWRMEGEPRSDYAMEFTDVPDGVWYTEAVRWAAAKGIVGGYSADFFGPDDSVSREQLAVILWRYAWYKGIDAAPEYKVNLGVFIDAERVSYWASEGVQWAVDLGLLTGVGNEKLSPETNASRAQVATILMRFHGTYFE